MTTINALDDFLQALDANPSWLEAVRSRILGPVVPTSTPRVSFLPGKQGFNQPPLTEEWLAGG